MSKIDPWIWIAAHGGKEKAAANRDAPLVVLGLLRKDDDWRVRLHVAENPAAPEEMLRGLNENPKENSEVRRRALLNLASNPKTSRVRLDHMVHGLWEDDVVQMTLAANPSLGKEHLVTMSWDERTAVRNAVAVNPSTPVSVLRNLARDDEPRVRLAAEVALEKRGTGGRQPL